MAGARLRAVIAALVFSAAALPSANALANPVRTAMLPADRYGELVATDEEPVANAVVRFPAGHSGVSPLGVFWYGGRSAGLSNACRPSALASGEALTGPVRVRRGDIVRGTMHRARTSILVTGGGLSSPRRLPADTVVARASAPRALTGWVHLHLPADVLPAYPRRDLYLVAIEASFNSEANCPGRTRRIGEAAVRSALRDVRIELPPNYAPAADQSPPTSDLAVGGGLEMRGFQRGAEAGVRVAAAGDVNGDGLQDALVSAPYGGPAGARRGAVYVVFGRAGRGLLGLAGLEPSGFRIVGPKGAWFLSAAGAGDMDGDGLADIVVGAPDVKGGHVYVVHGKSDGAPLDLDQRQNVLFAVGGTRPCRGPEAAPSVGETVAGVGDVNGDGLGDLALVAGGRCNGKPTGGDYVVFGKRVSGDVDLRRLGSGGITAGGTDVSNSSLAGVGDVNGDGLADVVAGNVGYEEPSFSVLIPGSRTGGAVNLARMATRITSGYCSGVGGTVASAGDVNGDGLADFAVGTRDGCADNRDHSFVVFGRRQLGAIDVDALSAGGYDIVGTAKFSAGRALGYAGDVNGDGVPDLAIGDPNYSPSRSRNEAGGVIVVYGKANSDQVRLRSLGSGGRRWIGAQAKSALGFSVAGVGDFDGDGRPDLLAGMPHRADYRGGAWLLPAG